MSYDPSIHLYLRTQLRLITNQILQHNNNRYPPQSITFATIPTLYLFLHILSLGLHHRRRNSHSLNLRIHALKPLHSPYHAPHARMDQLHGYTKYHGRAGTPSHSFALFKILVARKGVFHSLPPQSHLLQQLNLQRNGKPQSCGCFGALISSSSLWRGFCIELHSRSTVLLSYAFHSSIMRFAFVRENSRVWLHDLKCAGWSFGERICGHVWGGI